MEPLFSPRMCAGERKGKNKRKKESKKERKAKNSHTQTGYPSLIIIIIESSNHRTQPPDQPPHLLTILFFWSSSSKNPPISMLNSNLAYQKKKSQQQPTTNKQPSLSVCLSIRETRHKKKLTLHRTTIMSTLQIRANFLLHNRFGSAETTCPTWTRFLHHYPDTNTLASFDSINYHDL